MNNEAGINRVTHAVACCLFILEGVTKNLTVLGDAGNTYPEGMIMALNGADKLIPYVKGGNEAHCILMCEVPANASDSVALVAYSGEVKKHRLSTLASDTIDREIEDDLRKADLIVRELKDSQ